jgi:hypothetical protein
MKLLKNEKTENYHEIEVEYSFLWIIKWKVRYRKIGSTIFRFSRPNNYSPVGLYESVNIGGLFNVKLETAK